MGEMMEYLKTFKSPETHDAIFDCCMQEIYGVRLPLTQKDKAFLVERSKRLVEDLHAPVESSDLE